jgi:putative ABC transport system permease protein
MRWLGWGCLMAVLALVANAIVLSVQDRIREHAVLQTLGFRANLIARLIIGEGLLLGLLGGLLGSIISVCVLQYGRFALSVDGLSIPFKASAGVFATGLMIAAALGVLAGLVPAWQASRREIVACFRAA